MSIYKRECWVDWARNGGSRIYRKTFDNHLDRKKWIEDKQNDSRYILLVMSK